MSDSNSVICETTTEREGWKWENSFMSRCSN